MVQSVSKVVFFQSQNSLSSVSPALTEFVPLLSLQIGRRRRPRRDESSCCWTSWSYWSTSETRWSGTWTPRRNSKWPSEHLEHESISVWEYPGVCRGLGRSEIIAWYVASQPSCMHTCVGGIPSRLAAPSTNRVPGGWKVGARPLALGHSTGIHRSNCVTCVCACVCVYLLLLLLLLPDTSDLLTFALRRAEEEDEHLERTLEQNKGKMAKKEEKCVLQWLSLQRKTQPTNVADKRNVSLLLLIWWLLLSLLLLLLLFDGGFPKRFYHPDVVVVPVSFPRRDSALRRLCTNFILTQTVPTYIRLFFILTLVLLYQERYVYVIWIKEWRLCQTEWYLHVKMQQQQPSLRSEVQQHNWVYWDGCFCFFFITLRWWWWWWWWRRRSQCGLLKGKKKTSRYNISLFKLLHYLTVYLLNYFKVFTCKIS